MLAGVAICVAVFSCMPSDSPGGPVAPDPPDAASGMKVYTSQGCVACHTIGGKGGKIGPDLSNEANKGHTAQWLVTQLRNPKTYDASSIMPAYDSLTQVQLDDLAAYLLTLSTEGPGRKTPATAATGTAPASASAPAEHPAVAAAKNIKTGAQMWSDTCGRCHNYRAPAEFSDSQWAVVMQHMRLRVPLTGEQQRMILTFLQAGN